MAVSVLVLSPAIARERLDDPTDIQFKHKDQTRKAESSKTKAHKGKEHASKAPFGDIPKGPLQIVISINEQKLHLYSDGTHVADTLIATGVPEHPTPMGVFSVIQKERFHRSNIYSGAPMPFMQRITWSGVALHEGVNLGHPASHGCIRMSADFASRLWLLRSVGARVIIARPQLRPVEFADQHLFVHKELPAPAPSAAAPAAPETIKTAQTLDCSKRTDAVAPPVPPATGDKSEDRFAAAPAKEAAAPPAAATEPKEIDGALRLQPAEEEFLAAKDGNEPTPEGAGEKVEDLPSAADAAPSKDAISVNATLAADPATTATDAKPAVDAAASAPAKLDPPAALAAASSAPTLPVAATPRATGAIASPQPNAAAKPAVDAALEAVPMPAPKPPALAKTTPAKPITIFISRKTKRLYVRQNFSPLFEAPVTIADPGQPLGTHVFTALSYLPDGATMRWNVVSLPGAESKVTRHEPPEKVGKGKQRHEQVAQPVINPPPLQTPQEALARIEIPQDVIDQISALIVPGSSLIVSDQGLGDETGEGTDFIVVTR